MHFRVVILYAVFIQELLVFTVFFLYWTFTVNSSVVDVFVVTIEPLCQYSDTLKSMYTIKKLI